MTSGEIRVSSKTATLFLQRLADAGGDVDAVVRRYALGKDWREDPVMLPPSVLRALVDEIAERLEDPDLGVTVGSSVPRGAYGAVEYLSRSASTLGEGLSLFIRFSKLVLDHVQTSLETRGDELHYNQFLEDEPLMLGKHISELNLVFLMKCAREGAGGRQVPLERAWVAHPRAEGGSRKLEEALGCPVRYGMGRNGFAVARAVFELPMVTRDKNLATLMERQASAELASKSPEPSLEQDVRPLIRRALPHGDADCDRIASALHLSGRTLQRRLAETGTSFTELLDDVRREAATGYLQDQRLDLSEVALLLGYSDQPAFARAFKRWTGKSPKESRQELGGR